MSAVKAFQEKAYAAEHFDLSESNYSKEETIAILKRVVPWRESLLHFDHVCPSSEAREHHHCACCLCSCWCREQGEPLDHQTSLSSFFYFKWQCLYNTRNLKPSPAHSSVGASTYPNLPRLPPALLWDTKPPLPRAREGTHGGVWCGRREERERRSETERVEACGLPLAL